MVRIDTLRGKPGVMQRRPKAIASPGSVAMRSAAIAARIILHEFGRRGQLKIAFHLSGHSDPFTGAP